MAHHPSSSGAPAPPDDRSKPEGLPFCFWLIWALSVAGTAAWIGWPALWGLAPLDLPLLVIRSSLVGLAGLVALAWIAIRLAPWRHI